MSIRDRLLGQKDDTVYARAVPQRAELTETYRVKQEVSRNRSVEQDGDGAGRISIRVPYDGHAYFTRQAVSDVEKALRSSAGPDQRATIGHLLLADLRNASGLPAAVHRHNSAGVIPLTVPVATAGGVDLTGDRQTCVIGYDYQPQNPSNYPVQFTVNVHDLDSLADELDAVAAAADDLDLEEVRKRAVEQLKQQWRDHPQRITDSFRRKVGFSNELLLTFALTISVPVEPGYPALHPKVTKMSIEWPTLTSLRSTRLFIEDLKSPATDDFSPKAVRYNPVPVKGRLEWDNVPVRFLKPEGSGYDASTRMFQSALAVLKVGHPGDLFSDDVLEVNAEIKIPDYLMSGLQARLYDATGHPHALQPKLSTTLHIRATVYLGDIFAGRAFSPYQQFIFDDIIPDEIRITDICTVLRHSGFTVEEPLPRRQQNEATPSWLILARRSQGPDDLELRILVEGTRTLLDREQLMGTDVRISGSKESGRLKISALGTLHRDHQELARVMNVLQHELRDRFRFHQTSRK